MQAGLEVAEDSNFADITTGMGTNGTMKVELCRDAAKWDAFVASMPNASNYHRWNWKQVIEDTFGHEAHYLAAYDGENIRGILPMFRMKSSIFGHFLVSIPFFSYGGMLASSVNASEALFERAAAIARDLGVSHIELRQGSTVETKWTDTAVKVTMEVELPSTVEELSNRLSPKMRKRIRFARKNGLEPHWAGAEAVGAFYSVFSMNMRNLGTPVYPQSWFENLFKKFPNEIKILNLNEAGKTVASALVSIYRDTVELPWAATLPESRDKFSPLLQYWTLLEWALENGYKRVDLGRCTPGSGNHEFKKRWECVEKPLHWYYWLAEGRSVPQLRPDNPRFKLATEVWKRLPMPVANFLGPKIVRSIP